MTDINDVPKFDSNSENKTNETSNSPQPLKYKYEILPEDYTNFDLSYKLIVIGDSGVGKSCLTNNAVKNVFEEAYNATVGFEFFTFNVRICEKVVKLQIWDTCGQELYRSLITNFYRNSSLAIMVYAINAKESFENVEMWLRELRTHSNPDVKVFLIGNKIDLEKEREITREEGEKFYRDNKLNLFMEASAKAGINTQNIFLKAAEILYDDHLKYLQKKKENKEDDNSTIEDPIEIEKKSTKIKREDFNDKKKPGCCLFNL